MQMLEIQSCLVSDLGLNMSLGQRGDLAAASVKPEGNLRLSGQVK